MKTTIHCPLPYLIPVRYVRGFGDPDTGERNVTSRQQISLLTMMFSVSGGYVPTVNGVHKECWMNYVTNG